MSTANAVLLLAALCSALPATASARVIMAESPPMLPAGEPGRRLDLFKACGCRRPRGLAAAAASDAIPS